MRTILLLSIGFSMLLISNAQIPQGFNYQAIVRDSEGQPVANQSINIRATLQNQEGTEFFYRETHTPTTSPAGLITLTIGEGSPIDGIFESIPWSNENIFLKIEVENNPEEYLTLGVSKLQSVPYALHAQTANQFTLNPNSEEEDPIFVVHNRAGQIVLAIYEEGIRMYVDDTVSPTGEKSNKSGFAIGGFTGQKEGDEIREFLRVTPDSVRVNTRFLPEKGNKGGFAIGGYTGQKSNPDNFMFLTPINYFIGHEAGKSTDNGQHNSFIGYQAGMHNLSGSENIFLGYQTGWGNTSGQSNVFIGNKAGYSNSTGNNNITIGQNAGYDLTSGIHNTLIGSSAGRKHTNQSYNVMIGTSAGYNIISSGWDGSFNTFMGINAGYKIQTSKENTFLGTNAGYMLEAGNSNTIVGIDAGRGGGDDPYNYYGYTVNANSIFGCKAGINLKNGSNNLFLGAESGSNNQTGSGNIFIGYKAGYNETGSNKLYIENTNAGSANALIYGEFDNKILRINANLGINTAPDGNHKLKVSGSSSFDGAISATSFTGPLTGNVTGNLMGNVSGNINDLTLGKISRSASGVVVSIYNGLMDLYWDAPTRKLTIRNTSGTYCHVWWQGQQQTTTDGGSIVLGPSSNQDIVTFPNPSNLGWGYQIHFGEENGSGYCTVFIQSSNGKIFGHYTKY